MLRINEWIEVDVQELAGEYHGAIDRALAT